MRWAHQKWQGLSFIVKRNVHRIVLTIWIFKFILGGNGKMLKPSDCDANQVTK